MKVKIEIDKNQYQQLVELLSIVDYLLYYFPRAIKNSDQKIKIVDHIYSFGKKIKSN